MNKEEFLKAIMELPKVETNNPISTMNSINVDDLINVVDRFKKIPDYNDLLKENQKSKDQQKEFIKYLENMLDDENDIFSVVRVKDVLQKYKKIIGEQI